MGRVIRRRKPVKYPKPATTKVSVPAIPRDVSEDARKHKHEFAVLEKLRPHLVAGETDVTFRTETHGNVTGTFKKIENLRIMVVQDTSGIPLTCWPSEVTSPKGPYW